MIGIGIVLYINLQKFSGNDSSVITRVLANYMQILTCAAALNLSWPI
jgi:hypothetical protein